ncbi:hypothetical protein LSH36_45g10046 [Paralvinella palmiformis]|uniref:Uncharacterized protein n=1 Tax=Paralvinella palmiformis TaxID=53620 RepID=A0AAD9K6J7_9ANNE|nr:hypothetical protein LSH36_45g10046 [Paralvinella palmiformis]
MSQRKACRGLIKPIVKRPLMVIISKATEKQQLLINFLRMFIQRLTTQMNVLMLVLDSMSHMSYQRLLPKTYAYLKDNLKAAILDGYNIVGDGTLSAFTPILTENSTINRGFCFGPRPKYKYIVEYVKDFFKKYSVAPKFTVATIAGLSHANNDPVASIDLYLKNFLEDLRISGYMNNTLLIMMGDHGQRIGKLRYTTQGSLEERLPMMSLTFPETFRKQYPHLMKNLINNKKRLSTPFDLHETLQSILNIYNAEKPVKYTDRGISLLNVIPINRTCQSAGIELHWCTCKKYEILNTTDKHVNQVATYIVSHINQMVQIADKMCAKLTLKKIYEAKKVYSVVQISKPVASIDRTEDDTLGVLQYQLTVETAPNNGFYEATVHKVIANNSFSVIGDISRINLYGDQPNCIIRTYPNLRRYCFCKKTIDTDKH